MFFYLARKSQVAFYLKKDGLSNEVLEHLYSKIFYEGNQNIFAWLGSRQSLDKSNVELRTARVLIATANKLSEHRNYRLQLPSLKFLTGNECQKPAEFYLL